jgi:diguanylate cyclase (GGDEF)-like protein/PAS domain S-box-containing protein
MTLAISHDGDNDFRWHQRALEINNSTLRQIAQAAPLEDILSSIVRGVEQQHPTIAAAVLLLDEEEDYLYLNAGPSLPAAYRSLLHAVALDAGDVMRQIAPDTLLQAAGKLIEGSRFWRSFRQLALQHQLYPSAAIPVVSASDSLIGILVAYSEVACRADARQRQALCDVAPLAAIAIERSHSAEKIKRAERTLHESETLMALAIEGSGTGIWDRNVRTGEIHYSAGWKAILGYGEAELTTRIEDSYTRVHPDDLGFVQAAIQAHLDGQTKTYKVEHRIRCKNGSYKWILSRGKVVSRDPDGQPLHMVGTTTDITAMRALSEQLRQNADLITCLTNEVPGMVFQYRLLPDKRGFLSYVSDGIEDIYELTPAQVIGNLALLHALIHPDDLEAYHASLAASAAALTPWHLEFRVILPRQGLRWRRGEARLRRLSDGSTIWHGFITDVTDRKRSELELQAFATIDFLTELPNRRCFMACMGESLRRIQCVADTRAAVLMYDLDHFKTVNDTYGHAIGDLALRHFAGILRDGLRKHDTVGRVGGEEFAVVLADAGIAEALIFAKRVQAQLRRTPLVDGNHTIPLTVSIGIALMQGADANVDAALMRSDLALYHAKKNGRNRIEVAEDYLPPVAGPGNPVGNNPSGN